MKKFLIIIICFIPFISLGQTSVKPGIELSEKEKVEVLEWYVRVHEKGIEKSGDTIITGQEFQKVLEDEKYRETIYPETYTWDQALVFVKNRELKQALWYFVNLYPQNKASKEFVIKSILAYDKLFEMEELMVNSFYTYSFMDPEISIIQNGNPEIVNPDILEAKLRVVKEIVAYVQSYRNEKSEVVNAK